jgi:integrase
VEKTQVNRGLFQCTLRVQVLLGHSTIRMTFDVYGHLFPSADSDQVAMGQLQARLVVV